MSDESLDPTNLPYTEIPWTETPPEAISNYRLLQKLGEGGMGEVYEAEQEQPIRRRVALKIIKQGMDSKQVVGRFEAERQALALMNHPNIAHVFEAGTTERGRPYFAMEYVPGASITRYCDKYELGTRERLELFIQVCEGVQHAHQKGIIHRDIKPSNVLVTVQDGKPVPKIIDFGVAKAIGQRLTQKTFFTNLGQLIGTPEYMSPEQAEMAELDIDTRTDVYALGALLYELLVGLPPFDSSELRQHGFSELRRRICEEEPPRPSTRVSRLAAPPSPARTRRVEASALSRQLRGDLDWITMKALEKDRTRRYPSPSELAADIRRHLNHEPVMASPPGTGYRVRKFIRRHKVGVAAAGVIGLTLFLGAAGSTIGLLRATRAERVSRLEAETSERVLGFLVGLFRVSDPGEARGNTITAREILDRGAQRIRQELVDQPLVRARLMSTMGDVYRGLGLYPEARSLLEESLVVRESLLGKDHPDVAASARSLAVLLVSTGDYDGARPLLERALKIREQALGPAHPDVAQSLSNLGVLRLKTGQYEDARSLLERALEIEEAALGPEHADVAKDLNNLGLVLSEMGRYQEARPPLERALRIREAVLGANHPDLATTLNNLGNLLLNLEDRAGARPLYERALAIDEKALGPDHPSVADDLNNLATLLKEMGEHEAARPLYERALAVREKILGADHPDVATSLHNMAELLRTTGDHAGARTFDQRALVIWERALGPDHPDVAWALSGLAVALRELGRYQEAEPLFERALAIHGSALEPGHPERAAVLSDYAVLLRRTDREAEAREMEARARAIRETQPRSAQPE